MKDDFLIKVDPSKNISKELQKPFYDIQDESKMNQEITVFSGHPFSELQEALDFINNKELAVELFDAFLAEYARTKDIGKAMFFAQCEWDC